MKPARARRVAAALRMIADQLDEEAAEAGAPAKPRAPVRLRHAPEPTNDVSASDAARAKLRQHGLVR